MFPQVPQLQLPSVQLALQLTRREHLQLLLIMVVNPGFQQLQQMVEPHQTIRKAVVVLVATEILEARQ
jgi:hypothetical protein